MSIHFHKLKVKKLTRETPECVSIEFDVPQNLLAEFAFKEGQNITIKKTVDGEDLRRSYSICAAPHEGILKVAVKQLSGGSFSSFANKDIKIGDELEIMPPTGKFSAKLTPNKSGNYLAIAAGSGITPVISIIKHTLATQPDSSFTLIYGNRTRGSIIFFEELEGLKNRYISRFNLIHILSRERTDAEVNYGRINAEKLGKLAALINYANIDAAYICGPEQMIYSASGFLKENGVAEANIHFELFTTPGAVAAKQQAQQGQVEDAGPKSQIELKLDGRTINFNLGYNSKSILDAALQQGADLPFACKGGVCATCKAKLIEGQVEMDVNYALEADEVANGFILTCQSHPKSEKVVVDFDIK